MRRVREDPPSVSATLQRFPCGCFIVNRGRSCPHVNAVAAMLLGVAIETRNTQVRRARAESEDS